MVVALRNAGFAVAWVCEDSAGAADEEVLARSGKEGLTLLTLDKDFGDLIFRRGMAAQWGVILFRLDAGSPAQFAEIAVAALGSEIDWHGFFTVVTNDRIRMMPLLRSGA